jgi:transposase
MLFSIGIDWADQSHQICVRSLSDRRILAQFLIPASLPGLQSLSAKLAALGATPASCAVAIETNQGLLVSYLLDQGFQVHPIPPAAVKPYRARRRRTGAKSDPDDAQILSDILCQDSHLFPPLARDSGLVSQIRSTYRARQQLVRHRTQLINQLKSNLKSYFPSALQLFSSLDSAIAHAFLLAFPSPQAAHLASQQQLRSFFSKHHYSRPDCIPHILQQLSQPPLPIASWAALAGHSLTQALLAQLAVLRQHIARLEKELAQLLSQHPDAHIFLSLPRVGVILAAGLLGEIGDCRHKFKRAAHIQAFAGTAPVTFQSGSSRKVRFRFACNKPLRTVLQQFARQSTLAGGSAWARAYFSNQVERGHSSSRAYRALANRWVAIIFRLWQDGTHYQEDFHLKNIAKRQLARHPQPSSSSLIIRY